ncbi:UDP-N-acetylmuramoyl-L-alanine--D-glutamate ligase [Aliidiomarina soli]|uniref:UDP-N-acetylmuramoylalanine--D-glutamate ligase n=1 Tax=Aliidiomarina soli TaxID=1928574 RepID=A0A432WK00_9GAMM|nr:UDP-N-acetylmuramoyl-L-alanine--D-glutamate ligase [Aliidiomarina soli]RUO34061.1 UDP-N-acetylmuramoyl-L-alanine--D-glutamate ligase [Aliidiomarina soli]
MDVKAALQGYERIGVIGLGMTGMSAARFLAAHDVAPVLFDTRPQGSEQYQQATDLAQHECYLGELKLEDLLGLDLVIVSPGLAFTAPALLMARDAGVEFISDIELFARLVDVPVLAVTGSNGKSTVVSLTTHILRQCGRHVGLGGNIGIPALELLDQGHDCIVLELSSFQLEQTYSLHPAAACVLNVSPDHMDRYADLESYARVKNRIYRKADMCIYNRDDALSVPLRRRQLQHFLSVGLHADEHNLTVEMVDGEEFIVFAGQPLLAVSSMPMPGDYNKLNVQAALALVAALGTDLECAADAVASFEPLPHRCQQVANVDGVRWVNDSKATNAGACIAAIEGLRGDVSGKLILIAGGDGKGADLNVLKAPLQQVDVLITLGRDGSKIAALKRGAIEVDGIEEAVREAARHTSKDSLVLLSPACASLDMFRDYQQRGDVFTAAVEALYGDA